MEITAASRRLYDKLAQGWNTWDVSSVTAHVLLPVRLRVNVVLVHRDKSLYTGNAHWEQVERFGEHAADGSFTDLTLHALGGAYRVQSAAGGDSLVLTVTPVRPVPGVFAAVEVSGIWGSLPVVERSGDTTIAARFESGSFVIRCHGPGALLPWNPMTAPHLVVSADGPVSFTVDRAGGVHGAPPAGVPGAGFPALDTAHAATRVAAAEAAWRSIMVRAEGELEEGLAAMRRSLLWNMIYEPRNRRVVTPVSRNWCQVRNGDHFGHYVLFGWDTFFAALQLGLISRDLAYAAFFSILEERTPDGMVPNCGSGSWNMADRSEPQVGSLCAWKLYQQLGDRWFLEECFGPLLEWNRWRMRERDFNQDGLLEIASTPGRRDSNDPTQDPRMFAQYESGLDNSPMWDAARYDPVTGCIQLSYAGLNAEMASDCEMLAKIAGVLGRSAEQAELLERREKLSRLINERLWDEKRGIYLNRHWTGELDPVIAPMHLYALTAGIASPQRAARLIDEHLCNPQELWGDWVIATVSRSETSFKDQDYWRGRIWAPTNFLVGEGIFRYGRFDVWHEVVARGLGLLLKAWREKGVVGENYDAVTGEAGKPGTHSDPFYHWGALLAYMAVERIINFNEFEDRVDLHPLPPWASSLSNVPCGRGTLDIRGSEARIDGKIVADTRGGTAHVRVT